jgi:hypothetical protein
LCFASTLHSFLYPSIDQERSIACSGKISTAAAEKEESHVFNPPASSIPDNVGLVEYLMYYNGRIGDGIKVTLAPRKVDFTKAPTVEGGVYIAAQVLALGVHLPLPSFVREVLSFYKLAPTQISPGSWRVVLGFAALGRSQEAELGVEEFRTIYFLKPLKDGAYCFSPRKGKDKLITQVPDSDSGWKNSIVLVTGQWESLVPEEWGSVPRSWGKPGTHFLLTDVNFLEMV